MCVIFIMFAFSITTDLQCLYSLHHNVILLQISTVVIKDYNVQNDTLKPRVQKKSSSHPVITSLWSDVMTEFDSEIFAPSSTCNVICFS